jgi:hypothetical protein
MNNDKIINIKLNFDVLHTKPDKLIDSLTKATQFGNDYSSMYCLLAKKLEMVRSQKFLHGGRRGAELGSELGDLLFVQSQPREAWSPCRMSTQRRRSSSWLQ